MVSEELEAGQAPDDETIEEPGATPDDALGGQEPEAQTFDAEYVRKLRSEAASYRKKLRELETAEEKRRKSQMSELDRIKSDLAEAQAARDEAIKMANERMLRSAVITAAVQASFADPADAWRLIDMSKLTVGDDGDVDGAEQAIKALAKAKPYLLRQTQPAGDINAEKARGSGKAPEDPEARLQELKQRFRI